MSNSVVPRFLPPPYNFTTEEDEETEEEEYDKGSFALSVLSNIILALALYGLTHSEVNVDFKLSISKSEKNKS